MRRLAKECELIEAALAYGAAQEKYSAEYDRKPPESIKRDGFTDVLFDEAQQAAVSTLNKARVRMETLAEALYAESRKESYCPRCNGHHDREGDAEEKCQRGMQFARGGPSQARRCGMTTPISATPWDLAAGNRWTIQSENHRIANDRGNETIVDAQGNVVAYVSGNNDEGGNGQMLSAAPAMAEALRRLVAFALVALRLNVDIPGFDPETHVDVKFARAALKQAGAL